MLRSEWNKLLLRRRGLLLILLLLAVELLLMAGRYMTGALPRWRES